MRVTRTTWTTAASIALAALTLASCGGDPDGESSSDTSDGASSKQGETAAALSIDDLRGATACPLEPDATQLPDGLTLGPATGDVDEDYESGLAVDCEFPVEGSTEGEVVETKIVANESADELTSMESDSGGTWVNSIYNATGVDKDELTSTVDGVSGDDIEVLEGKGESVAITPLEIEGGSAVVIVLGEDTRTGDELEAIAASLHPAEAA